MRLSTIAFIIFATVAAMPVSAQDASSETEVPASQLSARSVVPIVAGQRQTSELIAREAGIEPVGRIGTRIENRVQSRINNRIGRNYVAPTDVTSSFEAAGERARRTSIGNRR